MVKIASEIAGVKLKNPTILAAGILGLTGASLKRVAQAGAGAVTTKSIGIQPQEGYPNPTIVEVENGLVNAMGLPNPGYEAFKEEVPVAKEGGVPVIVSVFGGTKQEYALIAETMEDAGADMLELNVSCPHTDLIQIGSNPNLTAGVVEAVKKAVSIPVIVKLPPNSERIKVVAKAAEKAGADAISAINTVKTTLIDSELKKPILGSPDGSGGLSGPIIKPLALKCVSKIYQAVSVPVMGVGGIVSGEDAVEMMMAGASFVQVGTGIFYRGLKIFKEITQHIQTYLKAHEYSAEDIVGLTVEE